MNRFMKSAAILAVIAVVGGCFNARIETGPDAVTGSD